MKPPPPLLPTSRPASLPQSRGELPASKGPRIAHIWGADGQIWAVDGDRAGFKPVPVGGNYDFEMSDATDDAGPKVLILDGYVIGPNDDHNVLPTGMGADDFKLSVSDGDDIYLDIDYNATTQKINSIGIGHAPSTPDDTDGHMYLTLGWVEVSGTPPSTSPRNQICGDIRIPIFPPPPDPGDPLAVPPVPPITDFIWGYDRTTMDYKWYKADSC